EDAAGREQRAQLVPPHDRPDLLPALRVGQDDRRHAAHQVEQRAHQSPSRSAVIGLTRAALQAGTSPETTPARVVSAPAISAVVKSTSGFRSIETSGQSRRTISTAPTAATSPA